MKYILLLVIAMATTRPSCYSQNSGVGIKYAPSNNANPDFDILLRLHEMRRESDGIVYDELSKTKSEFSRIKVMGMVVSDSLISTPTKKHLLDFVSVSFDIYDALERDDMYFPMSRDAEEMENVINEIIMYCRIGEEPEDLINGHYLQECIKFLEQLNSR